MRLASPLDVRVVIPLDSGDTLVALAFPLRHRVLLVPGVEQLGLLAGEVEIVTVAHIEIGAGNAAARAGRGLGDFLFKINLSCSSVNLLSINFSILSAITLIITPLYKFIS